MGVHFRTIDSNAKIGGSVLWTRGVPKTDNLWKKHKLFYNFTNITIKMVKFYPNSISWILNLLRSFNRPFQLYIVGYMMSVLGGSVLGTFPPTPMIVQIKWPYPAKACFGVIMNFYILIHHLGHSLSRNQADASLASLRNFLEDKNKMATQQSPLGDVFTCKPLRNTILGSTLVFSGSRNPIIMKQKLCLWHVSWWPPYKYEK